MRVEIILINDDIREIISGLDEFEDLLEEILDEAGFGDVSGNGLDDEMCNIDIEIEEDEFSALIEILKTNNDKLTFPPSTQIRYFDDGKEMYSSIFK